MRTDQDSADHVRTIPSASAISALALELLSGDNATAIEDRFWVKVDPPVRSECWEWNSATGAGGYGMFKLARNRTIQAHRLALIIATSEAPADREAAHSCDNPLCCRPSHLRWATRAENEADKGRAASLQGEA